VGVDVPEEQFVLFYPSLKEVYSSLEHYFKTQALVPELIPPQSQHRAVSVSITPITDYSSSTPKVQQRARRSLNEIQVSYHPPSLVFQHSRDLQAWRTHYFLL